MDRADRAQEAFAALTDLTIQNIRNSIKRSHLHTGFCFYCYEPVHSPHLYCDVDCRDLYEENKRMDQIEGK